MSAAQAVTVRADALKAGDRFMHNGKRHLVEKVTLRPHPSGDAVTVRTTYAFILFAPGESVRLIG